MRTAEARLAEWHRLYLQLERARAELPGDPVARDPATQAKRKRVARLEQECDRALGAVLAVIGTTGDATPRHTRSRLA